MAQSISTKKFGALDTSGRVPVYFAGKEGDAAPLNMGLSFDVGGKSYVFIPEDRITKGATSGDQGRAYVGFLNPNLLSSLKDNSEYIDIAGSQFGSFDAGKFISDQMGGSTKGYLTTQEIATPILNAGVADFNPQQTGQLKGIGNFQGQPVYYGDNGYVEPSGKYNYRQKTGQEIIGYRYSSGGGLLAGLGNELLKAGPLLPLALDVAVPGLGTAVAGGIAAGSLAAGDEQNALRYGAQYAAGTFGAGGATEGSGALASQTAAEASSGLAGAGAAGSAGAGALAAQMAAEGSSGANALAAGNAGAGALAAQTAAEASSAVPLAGAGTAAGTGALASQMAAEGSSAIPLAGAGAVLPAAAAAGTASWMTPAAIVGSSLIGANAAQKAAQTQSDAAAQANQLLAQMYATQRADLAPFTAAGIGAQNKLLTFLGLPGGTAGADYGKYTKDFTGADLLAGQDPGYAFRLSEGQKALERSAAARGGLLSGGTGKALTSYGQQMGSQEYQNAYNRYQTNRANQLAPLFTLTGSGQASAAGQAAAAGNYGTGAANNLTSAGAARAAGDVGTVNALTGGLNTYLGYTSQQDLLNAYNARTAAAKSAYS
jgi:hypothetical protein